MFNKKKSYSIAELTFSTESLEKSFPCKNPVQKRPPEKHNPFLGFIYTFITSVVITLTSVFVKQLAYINPGHLSFTRNAGVFAGCLPIAVYSVREVMGPRKDRTKLLVRGFLGATALYLNMTAFRYLPLAEAAVVMSTTPALTSLLAFFYLKEAFSRVQGFSLVMTVAGVLLSVRLPELLSDRNTTRFDYVYLGGLASAVGCVVFLSIALVTLRKMKDIHFSVSLLYLGAIGMAENAAINSVASDFVYPQCGRDQILVMLIGILGFVGNCTLTLAIQKENVGIVSILKSSLDIVIAMVFQIIFFNRLPDAYNIGGACLVIAAVGTVGIRNWLKMLPEESNVRKRLRYFLL